MSRSPSRRAHLDVIEFTEPSVLACVGHMRQLPGLFVGGDQPVEADDRRAVARERVVDGAEERQRVCT